MVTELTNYRLDQIGARLVTTLMCTTSMPFLADLHICLVLAHLHLYELGLTTSPTINLSPIGDYHL